MMNFYLLVQSLFGVLAIIWQETPTGPVVSQVFLPQSDTSVEALLREPYPDARVGACREMKELADRIQRFFAGEDAQFALAVIDLDRCPDFQQRVLRAEYDIPRGWVSSYGRIACHLGIPKGARAVGNALANNPFPIIIPCHRAIRSDGSLGGYQGGPAMKRALLEMEGVEVSLSGRVATSRYYY